MKGNVAAAPLAIVDGTYLCLLPPTLPNTGAANDDEEDVLHYVPALPCTEVWKHCGPKTVNNVNEMTASMHVDGICDDDDVGAHDNKIVSNMKTIPIRLSDISKLDFRFIHPVNLTDVISNDGGSSSVVQVSSCTENNIMVEERMAWSNKDNICLEICLPSMTCDYEDEHDFECLEDDDCDVYGDTSCMDLSQKIRSNTQSSSSFQVHGGGSCLIADFTGIGGFDQALILPQVDSSLILEDASLNNSNDESVLTQRKHLLQTILANSVLTDGSSVFLPRNTELHMSTGSMDTTIFKLTPVNREVLSQCRPKQNTVSSQSMNIDDDNKSGDKQTEANDKLTKEDSSGTSMQPTDPEWLEAIEQTIESRLAKQVAKAKQLERTTQVQSDLIQKGRETIHKASRLNSAGGSVDVSNDPQILRLRYGTRPSTVSDTQKGLSAVIDLELDMHLPHKRESTELHDFHVSCTLASKLEQHITSVDNIVTQSGVVPVFQNGNCITILASLLLNELDLDFQTNRNSTSMLDFNVQGLWLDEMQKRQGSVLCILRLPLNGILFSPMSSVTRAGHCIQHEIDFTSADKNHASRLVPSAIIDYRHPRTLNIDVSGSIGLQDGTIWKDLVSKLNRQIGMSSCIDLYYIKGDPTLKLVIFASNPAELAAITNLVLQNLPNNAKIFEQDPDEAKNVKALLVSLKNEAEAFQKHKTIMAKGTVTAEMRKEMSSLQTSTDGVASTIKRGWV
eukprot:scaffold2543_cov94-Skeletonema_dohrnii-CCMP3373.AAC.4